MYLNYLTQPDTYYMYVNSAWITAIAIRLFLPCAHAQGGKVISRVVVVIVVVVVSTKIAISRDVGV